MRLPPLSDTGSRADLWAGLAGGLFAPVATFGLGLPLWASVPGAVLIFIGGRLALAPRDVFEGLDAAALEGAALDLARDVIAAAQSDLARLQDAARGVRDPAVRQHLDHLHGVAERVAAAVSRRPARLSRVQRLLTYYLPASVRLGEGFRILEGASRPDAARLQATARMIGQLDTVFARHADRLSAPEIEGLDVELKLLADAIRAEGPGSAPAPTATRPSSEPAPWR